MNAIKVVAAWATVSLTASAMTVDELKSAIADAAVGGTVEVSGDVEITESLSISKKLTLRGVGEERPAIRRTAGVVIFSLGSNGDLTLENLILDGNKGAGVAGRALDLSCGTVTLGSGATIRDFKGGISGLINLTSASHFVMEDGSEISGLENTSWGLGVVVNSGAIFDMKGGLITECAGMSQAGAWADQYDGVVYLNAGTFNFSGGKITGNTSSSSVAGINLYSGTMNLSGDATCTNNVGGYANDLMPRSGTLTIDSGYEGWMTWFTVDRPTGRKIGGVTVAKKDGASYCYGFGRISNQKWPELVFDGAYEDSSDVVWGESLFKINGVPCCWWDDVKYAMNQGWNCDVTVLKDFEATSGALVMSASAGNMTFRGVGNGTRIWRPEGKVWSLWRKNGSKSTLRFENIILDGSGVVGEPLVSVNEGRLELGQSAVLRNSQSSSGPAAVSVEAAGTVLSMEEGAVICDCQSTGAGGYGTVIRIGGNAASGCFEMSGGLITNCTSATTQSASASYGAMVYVYRGVFEMTGGKIAGNNALNSSAGVLCYAGAIRLGGTAVIENNEGASPDIYLYNKDSLTFFGDYCGRAGISSPDQGDGNTFRVKAESGATGAWCFFAAGSGSAQGYIGMTDETASDGSLIWGVPSGSVNGKNVASAGDAGRAMPKTIVADEAGRATLPISISGIAAEAQASTDVKFDLEEFESKGIESLVLVRSTEAPLTGRISFSLPEGAAAKWRVSKRGNDYVLMPRSGFSLTLR